MDSLSEKLFDSLRSIPKSYYLPIGLALIGLVFLIIGLIQLSGSHATSSTSSEAQSESKTTTTATTKDPNSLFGMEVDVEGAVMHPGVYKLSQNARVQDALVAAGGLSATADREVVAKSLNLAAKITDGVKIYVPNVGEEKSTISQGTVLGAATLQTGSGQAGLVNINSAGADELDALPGVGPVTAQKIISARPFASTDDLLSKKAVSNSVFQKIKDKITVY